MKIIIAGRAQDRDRLRSELIEAGMEVVAETSGTPEPASIPRDVDAVIIATPRGSRVGGDDLDLTAQNEPLTAREREVLARLADGLSNKGIAGALGISDQTVKFHVAAIIGKLGARNRTDAVRRAIRRGLVAI